MYRKIFRCNIPKKDYRNVSSKKPPVSAFEVCLATLPVFQVLQQFGPCAEPFQPAVHDFRVRAIRGYQGRSQPPVTDLVETVWKPLFPWNEFIRKSRNQKLLLLGWWTDAKKTRQSAWRPPSLPSFRWLGVGIFWSRDFRMARGWNPREVDGFSRVFFPPSVRWLEIGQVLWGKKIHGSFSCMVFVLMGEVLIGGAIWERKILTDTVILATLPIDWFFH